MKKQILISLLGLFLMQGAFAAETKYEMRVDGLACPFCAYGIEKKLKAMKGSSKIDVDLDKGIVHVNMADATKLIEVQMKKYF